MKVYWTTMRQMYWWLATWSRPWEIAWGSFVSSVTIQTQTTTRWLSGIILCCWRGDSHTMPWRFIENWTELFCCSLWSAKVLEYEYGIWFILRRRVNHPLWNRCLPLIKICFCKCCEHIVKHYSGRQQINRMSHHFVLTEFGWEWLNNVPSSVIASGPPAPPDLMKIVSCQ